MSNQINEILCQAIDIISKQNINAVKYDTTLLCTIKAIDDEAKKAYQVFSGASDSAFTAYALGEEIYQVGDQVYVTIPQGNYDEQKFILRRYTGKDENPIKYKQPFDNLLDVTGDLIDSDGGNLDNFTLGISILAYAESLVATSDGKKEKVLGQILPIDDKASQGYTMIGLSADFRTIGLDDVLITEGDDDKPQEPEWVTEGTYGVKVCAAAAIAGENATNEETEWPKEPTVYYYKGHFKEEFEPEDCVVYNEDENLITIGGNDPNDPDKNKWEYLRSLPVYPMTILEFDLSTKDMVGNPYQFEGFFRQEKVFDIKDKDILSIKAIWYEFYQNGDFKLNTEADLKKANTPNLFVENIYFSLGYPIEDYKNGGAHIFSLNNTNYQSINEIVPEKHVRLRWLKPDKTGLMRPLETIENKDTTNIYWYRYDAGQPTVHPWAGVGWELLEDYTNKFDMVFTPKAFLKEERIKVIIRENEQSIISNQLIFENTNYVPGYNFDRYNEALSFKFNDGKNGNYFVYGRSNALLDQKLAQNIRQLEVLFKDPNDENAAAASIDVASKYIWNLPVTNSMLSFQYEDLITYSGEGENKTPNNIEYFDVNGNSLGNTIDEQERPYRVQITIEPDKKILSGITIGYKIAALFDHSKSNNTISCTVLKDENEYLVSHEFLFGQFGTDGSNAIFTLNFADQSNKALPGKEGNGSIEIYTSLIDKNGTEYLQSDKADNKIQIYYDWLTSYKKELDNNISFPIYYRDKLDYLMEPPSEEDASDDTGLYLDKNKEYSLTWTALEPRNTKIYYKTEDESFKETTWHQYYKETSLSGVLNKNFYEDSEGTTSIEASYFNIENLSDEYLLYAEDVEYDNFVSTINNGITISEASKKGCQLALNEYHVDGNLYILKATLKGWGNYDIVAYLPIPIRSDNSFKQLNGPTQIIYSTDGNPQYDNSTPYQLISQDDKLIEISKIEIISKGSSEYHPKIMNNKLIPSLIYVDNDTLCGIKITTNIGTWIEPILILKNRYFSSIIDEWDGALKIDEENNYILSAAIAAGSKIGNSFSGVVIGDWSHTDTSGEVARQTGLYGYHNNDMSFAFKEDGTAFIGKEKGRGRINFDGNDGSIKMEYLKDGYNYHLFLDSSKTTGSINDDGAYHNNVPFHMGKSSSANPGSTPQSWFSIDYGGNVSAKGSIYLNGITIGDGYLEFDETTLSLKDGKEAGSTKGALKIEAPNGASIHAGSKQIYVSNNGIGLLTDSLYVTDEWKILNGSGNKVVEYVYGDYEDVGFPAQTLILGGGKRIGNDPTIVYISANYLFCDTPAEQQQGIYARFR